MTAKREAELETENRMLREQVATLERILGQAVTAPVQAPPAAVPGNYGWWQYPNTWTSGGQGTITLCSGTS